MHRTARLARFAALAALVTSLTATAGSAPTASADPGASGEVAARWVERAFGAVRSGSPSAHSSTPGAGRTYAMVTGAMYDAVNAIAVRDGTSTRAPAIIDAGSTAPAGASRPAAASAAAHAVLASMFAPNATVRASLDAALAEELAALGDSTAVEIGRAWGADVGAQVLEERSSDGTEQTVSVPGGSGPGAFPRTFAGAQFRNMRPFAITDISRYRSEGPPPLAGDAYAEALNEVKLLGSITDTDPERAAIAKHWIAESGTIRESGMWLKIALTVAGEQGTYASLEETTRLLALTGAAIADAVAVSWSDKHDWHYWRPGDAIRQADSDGNPATAADLEWSPRSGGCAPGASLASCSSFGGTPEHTSGTSTFAGAGSTVLAGFYCTDKLELAFRGEAPGSPIRTYTRFSSAAKEAGRSRIFGGIHFEFSNQAGLAAGRHLADEILRTHLQAAGASRGSKASCTV